MVQRWRLIDSGPGEPAWNMAVDEALSIIHTQGGRNPLLRFYTWEPPALSLGYFQKTAGIHLDLLDELGILPVRRITGGRAVLHFEDLTYSLVACAGQDTPQRVIESYRYLCGGLLAAFTSLGISARLGSEKPAENIPASCFAVSTPGDITWRCRKFVGSAQKRFGQTLLQHGSVLLKPQEKILAKIFAGDLKTLQGKVTCLEDILGYGITAERVAGLIVNGFKETLDVEFVPDGLSDNETTLAACLVDKYRMVFKKTDVLHV